MVAGLVSGSGLLRRLIRVLLGGWLICLRVFAPATTRAVGLRHAGRADDEPDRREFDSALVSLTSRSPPAPVLETS